MISTSRLSRIAAIAAIAALLPAQNLLVDGDFEGTTSTGCNLAVSNAAFDAFFTNVHAYGSHPVDILTSACGTYGAPQRGSTFLGLLAVNLGSVMASEVALDLALPLTQGATYSLSLWASHLPSGSPHPFEVGVSSSAASFGTLVYSGSASQSLTWTNFTTSFTAPLAATHLTVRASHLTGVARIGLDNITLTGPAAATSTAYGTGCNGPVLAGLNRPITGTDWDLELTGLPAGSLLGFMLLDIVDPNLSLDPLGAPGCTQYSIGTITLLLVLPVASPAYSLTVPADPGLIGLPIHAQGGSLALGLNALGLAASNGVLGVVGDV